MVQKIYSKMHPASRNNTDYEVTDLLDHEMVKNTKTWISWQQNIIFYDKKKIHKISLRWHILRGYHFVAEVALNDSESSNGVWYWGISDISSNIGAIVEDFGVNVLSRSSECVYVVLKGNIPPQNASKAFFLPSESNPEFLKKTSYRVFYLFL